MIFHCEGVGVELPPEGPRAAEPSGAEFCRYAAPLGFKDGSKRKNRHHPRQIDGETPIKIKLTAASPLHLLHFRFQDADRASSSIN